MLCHFVDYLYFCHRIYIIHINMMKKILLFVLLSLIATNIEAQEGAWSGELDIQGTKLPLVFNFNADGCTIDSPSQGAKGIKAEKSITPEGKILVKIPMINAQFEGVQIMKMITGQFSQSGMSLPLTLKPGAPKPYRPQTPKAPFPYSTEEVTFYDGEVQLNGTLTLPQGYDKNTPVVLMVTGSGQQNRDEEILDHKPFAIIADALARNGIASLRYDDRGYGDKDFPFAIFTTYHFTCDAAAGVKTLRERFNKVGVLGHSEGGTIALLLAADGKADFIISLAGMAVTGRETLVEQNRKLFTLSGVDNNTVNAYCSHLDEAFKDIADGKTVASVDAPELPEALRQNLELAIKQAESPYIKHLLTTDVRQELNKIRCPVLALNGTSDIQVDCERNLNAIDKGLTNAKHKVMAMEGLNHLFQHCQTGLPTEYQVIEETISPDVLSIIIDWIVGL